MTARDGVPSCASADLVLVVSVEVVEDDETADLGIGGSLAGSCGAAAAGEDEGGRCEQKCCESHRATSLTVADRGGPVSASESTRETQRAEAVIHRPLRSSSGSICTSALMLPHDVVSTGESHGSQPGPSDPIWFPDGLFTLTQYQFSQLENHAPPKAAEQRVDAGVVVRRLLTGQAPNPVSARVPVDHAGVRGDGRALLAEDGLAGATERYDGGLDRRGRAASERDARSGASPGRGLVQRERAATHDRRDVAALGGHASAVGRVVVRERAAEGASAAGAALQCEPSAHQSCGVAVEDAARDSERWPTPPEPRPRRRQPS